MLYVYIDGASRGNPGQASIAYIIIRDNKEILEYSECIGIKTNNQAEYYAFIKAMEKIIEMNEEEVIFYSDSELLVKQINGLYRVKNIKLKELSDYAKKLILKINNFSIFHISREKNKNADRLCNISLNKH
jgi:ribonuclease HI